MVIEHKACPQCGNAHTVRVRRELSMCWNCKLHWSPTPGKSGGEAIATPTIVGPPDAEQPAQSLYPFTPRELRRLATHRAAVTASFYTDALDSHEQVVGMGTNG